MLHKCFLSFVSLSFAFQIFILILPIQGFTEEIQHYEGQIQKQNFQEWIVRYLNCIDEKADFDEVVDALISYKLLLQAKGYSVSPLYLMINQLEQILIKNGAIVDRDMMDFLQEELYEREARQCGVAHVLHLNSEKTILQLIKKDKSSKKDKKKKKEDWDFHFTKKGIFGLIKCIGGTLCALVPHPAATGVGIGLITDGIKDILDDQRDAKSAEEIAEERARIDRSIQNNPL